MKPLLRTTATILIMGLLTVTVPVALASSGPKLLVNVTRTAINAEDGGSCGYWALDNFTEHMQIWLQPDGTFLVNRTEEGFWRTFAGAVSPNADCTTNTPLEGNNAQGRWNQTWLDVVTGTFNPSLPTHGYLGIFNQGGTESDILRGTYNNQVGDTSDPYLLAKYIPGFHLLSQSVYYIAHYRTQAVTITYVNWILSYAGNIVT